MATYGIFKIDIQARDLGDQEKLDYAIRHQWKVDEADEYDFAVQLAQAYAEDHAKRIDVPWASCGDAIGKVSGGSFTTNNGTKVWYRVKPIETRDERRTKKSKSDFGETSNTLLSRTNSS